MLIQLPFTIQSQLTCRLDFNVVLNNVVKCICYERVLIALDIEKSITNYISRAWKPGNQASLCSPISAYLSSKMSKHLQEHAQ